MAKALTALALSLASFGCMADSSGEYVEQEITGCSCGAQIVKETRSTDEWLRLSEYIRAGGNSTGVAYEIIGDAGKANCLVKSIYMFTEAAGEYSETGLRDDDCDNTVDALVTISSGRATEIPRALFGDAQDRSFLEMESEFDANFGIERKIEEWRERIQ